MSPLGIQILKTKRVRAVAAAAGERRRVWGLTLVINVLVKSRRYAA